MKRPTIGTDTGRGAAAAGEPPPFVVMAKPVGSVGNLAWGYCYSATPDELRVALKKFFQFLETQ